MLDGVSFFSSNGVWNALSLQSFGFDFPVYKAKVNLRILAPLYFHGFSYSRVSFGGVSASMNSKGNLVG